MMKTSLSLLLILMTNLAWSQISEKTELTFFFNNTNYEDFHKRYTPHNEVKVEDSEHVKGVLKFFKTPQDLGSNLTIWVTDYLNRESHAKNYKRSFVNFVIDAPREMVGQAIGTMKPAVAAQGLAWVEGYYLYDIMFYVDAKTYKKLAPKLAEEISK